MPTLGNATTRYLSAALSTTATVTGDATTLVGSTAKYLNIGYGTSGTAGQSTARRFLIFNPGQASADSNAVVKMVYIASTSAGTHNHSYNEAYGVGLTANTETGTGRITYVENRGT